jgi:Ca2+-transporting ATPase
MGVLLLAGQSWLVASGWSAEQGRTIIFCTLVLGVMLLVLANRDLAHPAWHGLADPNPWLARMAGVMALLLLAVLGVPWLRELMGLALPGAPGALIAAALLGLCLLWLELLRWLRPKSRRHA